MLIVLFFILIGSTDTGKTGAPLPTAAGQSRPALHGTGSKTVQVVNQSKPTTQNPLVVTHMTPGGLALRPGGIMKNEKFWIRTMGF